MGHKQPAKMISPNGCFRVLSGHVQSGGALFELHANRPSPVPVGDLGNSMRCLGNELLCREVNQARKHDVQQIANQEALRQAPTYVSSRLMPSRHIFGLDFQRIHKS